MQFPMKNRIKIYGHIGKCGDREVFLGFAPASLLNAISFPDVLDERTGKGYQRAFSQKHSLDFRNYIQKEGSTTIPLTFNIRKRSDNCWELQKQKNGFSTLIISHRLTASIGLDV